MISVLNMSELNRSFFSLWTLLLCIICIFSMIISVTQKRYRFTAISLIPFFCGYFMWQALFDVHLAGGGSDISVITRRLCRFSPAVWVSALLVLTAAAVAALLLCVRYGKRSITPNAVKQCLDSIPCGVCCFSVNGMVLFSNVCMRNLCVAVTGGRLLSGKQFYEAVGNSVLTVEGRRWRFTCRDILLDGERLHEMTASDVTAEYAKTEALERDKAELSKLNIELKEYTLGIDDAVRRNEILQAKVNIHDEMNRLMLSTQAAKIGGAQDENNIFSLWERNALLLCMEAESAEDASAVSRITDLAKALNIKLLWDGGLPPALYGARKNLFFLAAREAIANAAKHSGAGKMEISFEETNGYTYCRFTNDGCVPSGEVRFAGGLYNLSVLAKKYGSVVSVNTDKDFTVELRFENEPA